jgi:hypothetical protein
MNKKYSSILFEIKDGFVKVMSTFKSDNDIEEIKKLIGD